MIALLPLLAAGVAGAFALGASRAASGRSTTAMRVWAFALIQFALASALLSWGIALGWSPAVYRGYYLFGAILNTTWLGLGTIWLLVPRLPAAVATAVLVVASLAAGLAVGTAPLEPSAAAAFARDVPPAAEVMPGSVRSLSRIGSIGGSIVVVGGLAWSIVRARSRATGLGLLVLGVLIVAAASEAARSGIVLGFSAGLAAGIAVMYAGFLKSR